MGKKSRQCDAQTADCRPEIISSASGLSKGRQAQDADADCVWGGRAWIVDLTARVEAKKRSWELYATKCG